MADEEVLTDVPPEPVETEVPPEPVETEVEDEVVKSEVENEDSDDTEGEEKQTKSQNAKQRLRRKLREEQDFNRKILEENQSLVVRLDTLEGKLKGVIDPPPTRPNRVDFGTEEEYEDSLFSWRETMKTRDSKPVDKTEPKKDSVKIPPKWKDQLEYGEDKYDDFLEVTIHNKSLNITDPMALTIAESDKGAEIAYHLGKNPKEADRIASLTFANQVKEILKLEQRFQKQTTSAPEPITPTKGTDTGKKDVSKMTPEEYRDYRLKQMAARY